VAGFVVDIVRPGLLIEIQTSSFAALAGKLDRLLDGHRMLLVHPIEVETYLARPGRAPRRAPNRATVLDLFVELVSVPTLLDHPNLTLDVVLVSVTRVQVERRSSRRGRGGFRTVDRQLREVLETRRFDGTADLARLLPAGLPAEFTTADVARRARVPRDVAQRMAYCLRALGVIEEVRRAREGVRYARG
jgi:hypothetical protein